MLAWSSGKTGAQREGWSGNEWICERGKGKEIEIGLKGNEEPFKHFRPALLV